MKKKRKLLTFSIYLITITIICAIIGIIVLYVGYTMRIQSAVEPVSIPYAKVTIQPRMKITEEINCLHLKLLLIKLVEKKMMKMLNNN